MKIRLVSLSWLLVTCVLAAPLQRKRPFQLNFSYLVKFLLGVRDEDDSQHPEDMLVIGAGFGRTGTSSFIAAMNRIGLKSYHMSAVMRTPDHLNLWVNHIQALQDGNAEGNADAIIDSMSINGFNSTSSMPACFLYKELMERYPNARVVLTVRGDGDGLAWAKSVKGSVGLLRKTMERVPFRWIPTIQRFKILFNWIFAQRGVYLDENLEFDDEELAASYNGWVEQVKETVPKDKLLVFAAQDGWRPLCDHLSPLSSDIEAECQKVLESAEPYPRVNEKTQIRHMVGVLTKISIAFEYGPVVLAIMAVLWFTKSINVNKKSKKA